MARVSTKEAGELIKLLVSTTVAQRPERWPSLLTLLIRWATQAAGEQKDSLLHALQAWFLSAALL